jgi:hypothetical protein
MKAEVCLWLKRDAGGRHGLGTATLTQCSEHDVAPERGPVIDVRGK